MIYRHFKGKYFLRLPDSWNAEQNLYPMVNYIYLEFGNYKIYARSPDNFTWRYKELEEIYQSKFISLFN